MSKPYTWDSYKVLMEIRKQMSELLEKSLRQFEGYSDIKSGMGKWNPPFDVLETEDEILVVGEIPGVLKEDLEVRLKGLELTIRGERRPSSEKQGVSYHQAERYYGPFERTFKLPEAIAEDRISTSLQKGLLEIKLNKQGARTIPIQ